MVGDGNASVMHANSDNLRKTYIDSPRLSLYDPNDSERARGRGMAMVLVHSTRSTGTSETNLLRNVMTHVPLRIGSICNVQTTGDYVTPFCLNTNELAVCRI